MRSTLSQSTRRRSTLVSPRSSRKTKSSSLWPLVATGTGLAGLGAGYLVTRGSKDKEIEKLKKDLESAKEDITNLSNVDCDALKEKLKICEGDKKWLRSIVLSVGSIERVRKKLISVSGKFTGASEIASHLNFVKNKILENLLDEYLNISLNADVSNTAVAYYQISWILLGLIKDNNFTGLLGAYNDIRDIDAFNRWIESTGNNFRWSASNFANDLGKKVELTPPKPPRPDKPQTTQQPPAGEPQTGGFGKRRRKSTKRSRHSSAVPGRRRKSTRKSRRSHAASKRTKSGKHRTVH